MIAGGSIVNTIPDKSAFQAAMKPVYEKFLADNPSLRAAGRDDPEYAVVSRSEKRCSHRYSFSGRDTGDSSEISLAGFQNRFSFSRNYFNTVPTGAVQRRYRDRKFRQRINGNGQRYR